MKKCHDVGPGNTYHGPHAAEMCTCTDLTAPFCEHCKNDHPTPLVDVSVLRNVGWPA